MLAGMGKGPIRSPKRGSDEPRTAKRVPTRASRITFGVTHDDMVEQFNPENVGSFPELAGHLDIGRAGSRITAGMIMLCCVPSYVE